MPVRQPVEESATEAMPVTIERGEQEGGKAGRFEGDGSDSKLVCGVCRLVPSNLPTFLWIQTNRADSGAPHAGAPRLCRDRLVVFAAVVFHAFKV